MKPIKLKNGWNILPDVNATVSFTGGEFADTINGEGIPTKLGGLRLAKWGKNNLLPQEMFRLVWGNHLKPQLISTSRDFLLGSRMGVFKTFIETDPATGRSKRRTEPVLDRQIEDFLEEVEAEKYMRRAAFNLEFFANTFSAISLNRQLQVEAIKCFDSTDIRAEVIDIKVGRIQNYYLHPNWEKFQAGQVTVIPAYDKANPLKYGEFLYHGRDETPGQSYYDVPAYFGSRTWTEVSNLIPRFHKSGLMNGYNIKYHIEIPRAYFAQFGEEKEQIAAEDQLLKDMNTWLSGVDNVGKAFISKFATDDFGKVIPGFKITPVENIINSEAYNKVDSQANIAHASAHGILPTLAGIDTGGKLGGSGSELRLAYQLHVALHTPIKRAILLEPFNKVIKKINGWNREHIVGFEDVDLTTLDVDPKGKQEVVNQAQQ